MTDIVLAPCGRLGGVQARADGVTAFLGVPYAAPPIDSLRWRPPRRLERWSGTRAANRPGPRCIQHAPYGELEPGNPLMGEDCLYLNVWTPSRSASGALPVILWIHGGEFWAGSGSEPRYDGAKLAARGAVVVTFNHRLGVFGFLSHPTLCKESDYGTSGNYGLMDQIAALQWVRENIEAFGGDPDTIAIAGESAGSCSVGALMTSPLAIGLFHRALGQSCAYFMPEPHVMKPLSYDRNEERGLAFAAAAGAKSLTELRALPPNYLLDTWQKDISKRMQPCIDGHVLPEPVEDAFIAGRQARVPLLAGWNGEEAGYMRAVRAKFDLTAFRERISAAFGGRAESLLSAYAREAAGRDFESAVALTSDRTMAYPTWKWAEMHGSCAPAFVYRFDRAPPGSDFGACHACEIEYVFGTLESRALPWTAEDRDLSDTIGDYWVNFARTGDPNAEALPAWPSYDPGGERMVMRLDVRSRAEPVPELSRLRLLDDIYAARVAG